MEKGASVNATTKSGKTALSFAINMSSLKCVEAIIKYDPSQVDVVDIGGSVPSINLDTIDVGL